MQTESHDNESPFLILSLAGGGYRGLFTAEILRHLEDAVGTPLRDHFDLITGTSIGGILGLGVAKGIPAKKLVDLLKDNGQKIFTRKLRHQATKVINPKLCGLRHALYSQKPLKKALSALDVFGEATIGDLQTRVMIPAVNLSKGSLSMFKTPHSPRFRLDWQYKLVDVALATSAAPTFFPVHEFANQRWADGGLVANDPSLQAVHEVLRFIFPGVPNALKRIRVITIGTASAGTVMDCNKKNDMGKLDWAPSIFDITINSQSQMSNDMMKHWLEPGQYFQIDEAPQSENAKYFALDNASRMATKALIEHATVVAQKLLSEELICMIRAHKAAQPDLFYGAHANQSPN